MNRAEWLRFRETDPETRARFAGMFERDERRRRYNRERWRRIRERSKGGNGG